MEVERKMLKRNLIDYLVSMLDRTFAGTDTYVPTYFLTDEGLTHNELSVISSVIPIDFPNVIFTFSP